MTTQINIDYITLKASTAKVLQFAKDYAYEKKIDLRTSVAEDLSLYELDGYTFLDKFQEKFCFTLPNKAYEYVGPPKLNLIQKILYIPGLVLAMPFFILAYPFMTYERKE